MDSDMDAATAIKVAATPQSVKWGFFDNTTPAVTRVASGAEVVIETVSGEPACLPTDPVYEILPEHRPILEAIEHGPGPHFLTGPVHVEGARPGDVLAVDILDVTLRQNWGFNLIIPLHRSANSERAAVKRGPSEGSLQLWRSIRGPTEL
jgi:acetamidase/formamidase